RLPVAAVPGRHAAGDPRRPGLRDDHARHRQLQRLHLRLPHDGRRPRRPHRRAADVHVPPGVREPRLRLRLGDRRHPHRDRARALARPAAPLPGPRRGAGAMRTSLPRAVVVARHVLLLAGAFVMVAPFLYMVSISITENSYVLTTPPQFIPDPPTTANYERVLAMGTIPRAFLTSLGVASVTTVVSLLVSSMTAYAFARFTFLVKELLFRVLLVSLM